MVCNMGAFISYTPDRQPVTFGDLRRQPCVDFCRDEICGGLFSAAVLDLFGKAWVSLLNQVQAITGYAQQFAGITLAYA